MSDTHEPSGELAARDRDIHRALTSLKEEIEAVDWYHQRVVLATDESLRQVLAHNRDEEIEHACMMLEWLRRNMEPWDWQLAKYLFSEGKITEVETGAGTMAASGARDESLGIRGLASLAPEETLP